MPAKKGKLAKHSAKMKKSKAKKPGAYQTHKGGPILNSRDSWLIDPFSKTADVVSKKLRGEPSKKKTTAKRGRKR